MADEQTPESKSDDVTAEAPQVTAAITQTPDGQWQSTLSVSFQVTSTWGPADDSAASAMQKKPSEGDTGDGGGSKSGIGAERRSRSSDGDTGTGGSTKSGLVVEKRPGA